MKFLILNNMVLVIYTHTDMQDIWTPFFDRMKEYMSQYKTYIFVNKDSDLIPEEYIKIFYDDSKKYTERLTSCINHVKEDVILFTHEDMILYSTPDYDLLQKYEEYILNEKANGIKLIATTPNTFQKSELDDTLVTSEYSKFSIQPTIIKRQTFYNLFENKSFNIWEFEDNINANDLHFMAFKGYEKKRGIFHYDSLVYPYIATAINKGKWNLTEYQPELNIIFEKYNINPFDRGIA